MKNRILAVLLAFVLAFAPGFAPWAAEASFADASLTGSGTAEDPYLIDSANALTEFFSKDAETGKIGKLTEDISITSAWTPVTGFSGTLDGQGHEISWGTISGNGFFNNISKATIKNIIFNGNVSGTAANVGGISGAVDTKGSFTIENCSFEGSVKTTKTSANVGGFVGKVNGSKSSTPNTDIKIVNSVNKASVEATSTYVGGIIGYCGYVASGSKIENSYNAGEIKASRAAGIMGFGADNLNVSNCFNIGTIEGTENAGGIYAFNGKGVQSCHAKEIVGKTSGGTAPTAENAITIISETAEGKAALLTALNGDAGASGPFVADTNNINDGYPILRWQSGAAPVPKEPKINVSGATLYMTNSGSQPSATLTATYVDMDSEPAITWTVTAGSDVISAQAPEGVGENNASLVVTALKPGIATVHAETEYNGETVEKDVTVKVMPYITAISLEGTPAAGSTYRIAVTILGGYAYDFDTMPELTGFTWKYYDESSGSTGETSITGNGPEITVPAAAEGKYITASLMFDGRSLTPSGFNGYRKLVAGADAAAVANDKAALSISTDDIKATTTLALPTSGSNGSAIAWASGNEAVINPATGAVTLPESGKTDVTLTATITKGSESAARTFTIKVWSAAAVAAETASDRLDAAVAALGDFYKISPKFGTDTNVLTMFKAKLAAEGFDDVDAAIKTIEPKLDASLLGEAAIAANGAVAYFYADPNTTPVSRTGSFDVTFTLSKGGVTLDKKVPVVFGWNADKVKAAMRNDIISKLTAANLCAAGDMPTAVTKDLALPNVVDNKGWTLVSWSSSDDSVIAIDDTGRQPLEPFKGKVVRPALDTDVTLTASYKFQFTASDGSEEDIIIPAVYNFTVKGDAPSADALKTALQAKLDAGFAAAGVKDFVTKAVLDTDHVKNDIQLPTTRDFGIDGKNYPVTLKSSNTDVLTVPAGNNNARAYVWRPLGDSAAQATLTVTITDKASGVSASKDIKLTIEPLTDAEINAEISLMEKAKAHYFDGIKGSNTDKNDITSNLSPFIEVYEEGGNLVWVRNVNDSVNHGIVADQIKGWQDLEQWRLFRSSNAAAIAHETLIVERQAESKLVTIYSYLSSETLGKYAEKYPTDERFQKLSYQPVEATVVVTGTNPAGGAGSKPVAQTLDVTMKIQSANSTWLDKTEIKDIKEGSTVFDVFAKVIKANGFKYSARGSYIYGITNDKGESLTEFDAGDKSGWMYKVNGKLPSVYMAACPLHDGDEIVVFFTKDYLETVKHHGGSGAFVADQPKPAAEDPTAQAAIAKTEEKTDAAGNKATIATDVNGKTATKVEVSAEAVKKAAEAGTAVALPVPQIKPQADVKKADSVKVELPNGTAKAAVTVPVTGADANTVLMKVAEDGTLTPVPTAVVTEDGAAVAATVDSGNYVVVENKVEFADVKAGDWFAEGAGFAGSRNLMVGVGGGKFDQAGKLTTAQTAAVIGRLKGEGTSESWNKAVAQFGNAQVNSRENTIGMLCAAYKELGGKVEVNAETGATAGYADADKISAENREAFLWAVQMGIIKGVGENRLDPAGDLTRGQFGTMLERFVKLLAKR